MAHPGSRRPQPPLAWEPPCRLVVYWAGQDDPRKNTAKRLAKHHMLHVVEKPGELPVGAILLDPLAKKALSRKDRSIVEQKGLTAIDCSWEHAAGTFLGARRNLEPRALPYLVAGNPTKYGQAFMLSTAEALAAALVIAGYEDAAHELMHVFPWAKTFFAVNAEPLAAYAECATSEEVVAVQKEFLPPGWDDE